MSSWEITRTNTSLLFAKTFFPGLWWHWCLVVWVSSYLCHWGFVYVPVDPWEDLNLVWNNGHQLGLCSQDKGREINFRKNKGLGWVRICGFAESTVDDIILNMKGLKCTHSSRHLWLPWRISAHSAPAQWASCSAPQELRPRRNASPHSPLPFSLLSLYWSLWGTFG